MLKQKRNEIKSKSNNKSSHYYYCILLHISQHAMQDNEGTQGNCGDREGPLIERLQEVFPDASRDHLAVAATRHPGDINRATEFLLQNGVCFAITIIFLDS